MKTNQFTIESKNSVTNEISQKTVVVTNVFKQNVEKLKNELISLYKENPEFQITPLNENETKYIWDNGFAPESEKINEYIQMVIENVTNDKFMPFQTYTYVDEYNEFGGNEDDLKICKKLDERYFQFKKIVDNIKDNYLNSDKMKQLDETENVKTSLTNSEYNAVASQIILTDLYSKIQ